MTVIDFFNVNVEKLINESFQETTTSTEPFLPHPSGNNKLGTAEDLLASHYNIAPAFRADEYLDQLAQFQN